MNIDDTLAVTLREVCEHTLNAERAENLNQVQDRGDCALRTLETIDRGSLEPHARGVIETAMRHLRNVQSAVHRRADNMSASSPSTDQRPTRMKYKRRQPCGGSPR